jgi:uncharacterized membrane protein YczE
MGSGYHGARCKFTIGSGISEGMEQAGGVAVLRPRVTWRKVLQILVGLELWAIAVALWVRSGLGLGPWDAFHYGIHVQTGMTIGTASILIGVIILAVTMGMKLRPGVATVLNMIFIGVFIDLTLPLVPAATSLVSAWAFLLAGIPLCGVASGMYIGAGLGHGPRDGLMIVLTQRTGWSVRSVRTTMEVIVLALGWLMGGTVGVGTIVITLAIGPAVQWGLRMFDAAPGPRGQAATSRWSFGRAA